LHSQLKVYDNIISDDESLELCQYIDNQVKRKRYQNDHFDHVIANYREFELINHNNTKLESIINRITQIVKQNSKIDNIQLLNPHIIDLAEDGYIGPHVDSIKFSGHLIAGLSLLSTRLLRLEREFSSPVNNSNGRDCIELYVKPKSLYILTNELRYEYTHSILGKYCTPTKLEQPAQIERRLSIMFRDKKS
jgi:alkylated DNA repair protein alkB family protein 7